jgi:hypothetical protein
MYLEAGTMSGSTSRKGSHQQMKKMEQQEEYLAQYYPIVMETSWNSSHDRH